MRFLLNKSVDLVPADEALPGRDEEMVVPERHEVLGTPLRPPFPEGFEQLVVGMGCFWGAERVFWTAPGVYTTAAGYGEITTEIAEAGPFYYAEPYHQQYLQKVPNGYCGLGGTGVACPVGLTRSAPAS